MANTPPFEIIAAPFKVYVAPVSTACPAIDATITAPWTLVGSSGDLNYTDEGVTVAHAQSIEKFRALGDSGSRKVFRTEEDLMIRLQLADLTLEQYQYALNGNSITTVPAGSSTPGTKKVGMSRGFTVATMALLVVGPSPYDDEGNLYFWVPRAAQTGNPEVVMRKNTPAVLALEWTALVNPDAATPAERFGFILAQHEPAES